MLNAKKKNKKKFPAYTINPIQPELLTVNTGEPEGDEQLDLIFKSAQQFAVVNAVEYAENEFFSRDIKSITADWLESFIKQLHAILNRDFLLLNKQRLGGEYADTQIIATKKVGIGNLTFEGPTNGLFSQFNKGILEKLYGETSATNYEQFSNLLFEKTKDLNRTRLAKNNDISTQYQHSKTPFTQSLYESGLGTHPGYQEFLKTTVIHTLPEELMVQMREFCNQLAEMIQNESEPVKIAAYCSELVKENSFLGANDPVANILTNCILISYGLKPINLTRDKAAYYEKLRKTYENAIEDYLKICTLKAKSETALNPVIPEDPEHRHKLPSRLREYLIFQYPDKYEVVPKEKEEMYYKLVIAHKKMQDGIEISGSSQEEQTALQQDIDEMHRECIKLVFNADYCIHKAVQFLDDAPKVAIYYLVKAADFSLAQEGYENAARHKLVAATLCCEHEYFDLAYDLLKEVQLNLEKIDNQELQDSCETMLTKLLFVEEHRLSLIDKANKLVEKANRRIAATDWKNKGDEHFNKGKFQEAINCYQKAVKIDQEFKEAWFNQAYCYRKLEQDDDALARLEKSLQIDPKYTKAVCHKAEILCNQKEYMKALQTIDADYALGGEVDPNLTRFRKECVLGRRKTLVKSHTDRAEYSAKRYMYVKQGHICRWQYDYNQPETLDYGFYTEAFFNWNIIILQSFDSSKIVMMHANSAISLKDIKNSITWVGKGCQRIVYIKEHREGHENFDGIFGKDEVLKSTFTIKEIKAQRNKEGEIISDKNVHPLPDGSLVPKFSDDVVWLDERQDFKTKVHDPEVITDDDRLIEGAYQTLQPQNVQQYANKKGNGLDATTLKRIQGRFNHPVFKKQLSYFIKTSDYGNLRSELDMGLDVDSRIYERSSNQINVDSNTLLALAAAEGQIKIVTLLLSRGARINEQIILPNGTLGGTPLFLAAARNHINVVKLLLSEKADPTIKTASGTTAAQIASTNEIVMLLKKARREHLNKSRQTQAILSQRQTTFINSTRLRILENLNKQALKSYEEGNYNFACGLFQQCLGNAKELWGENSGAVGSVYYQLGMCHKALDNENDAQESFRKSYDTYFQLFGRNDVKTQKVADQLDSEHEAIVCSTPTFN